MKKFGFGMMRLPLTDPKEQTKVDRSLAQTMMDTFLARGFTYVDTAYFYHGQESERVVRLREYVERMPEPERGVIKMYLDGYEPGEIADRLQMSVQSIYNLKSRAVNFLRRLFGQKSPGDGEA